MVEKPIVRSFCFVIDLRRACIFIAALKLITSIILFCFGTYVLFHFDHYAPIIFDKHHDQLKALSGKTADPGRLKISEEKTNIHLTIVVGIILCVINAIVSCLFIWSVISERPKHMKPYLVMTIINIIVLLLTFSIYNFIAAVIEIYTLICSSSLYLLCLDPPQERLDTVETAFTRNDYYNQPPQYNSCEKVESQNVANNSRYLSENP